MKKKTAKLSLFAITWPLFIEIMLYMLMGNADTLMLSLYSDNSVAAVGVTNQILSMVIVMFGFIATGTAILVAQNLGANQHKEAHEISAVSIGANLVFGLILSAAVFVFSEQLLNLMDLPPELFDEANSYLKIVGGFSFIQSLIMTISSIVRSYGFTSDIMYITIGMNVLNVIGNYFFIFGTFGFPVLGVEGVAISTTVSRIVGLLAAIYVMKKRIPGSMPLSLLFRFPKKHLQNLLHIGIPSAGENLSYNGSQMMITYFIATLGTQALTAKVYTQNIMMFIFLFSIAISQGTQILIGHMVGANEVELAYKRAMNSLKLAIMISIASAVTASFFSKKLLGIFTDNPSIIELGTILFLLTIILEPGRSFNLVLISSLRAAGDVKFPVYIGILIMWGVSVPLSYFLGIYLEMGLVGIWIAFIADEWLRGLLMLWRWKSRLWMRKSFVAAK
ncbi:MATE family efflux transporter [Mesobacillus subterraneus]|uniref:Transporter n=1 Tax=Mesobacillus subterraneus TaxID=285983 RepID=A0A0D6ZCJ4_9BACI|nr:MATE family efflux transporter [Mesobacillus subterraneus]KIY23252.1 transporter [Mesobacillus subterraneus]